MTNVEKSALVPYSASEMYSLVDDVKRYPEFLPWCGGAKVQQRDDETIVATLHIDYHGIKQSFTTENTRAENVEIRMRLVDGPLSRLDGWWRFQPLSATACKVTLTLDYGFANAILENAVGPVFGVIANTMMERFIARADALYPAAR